MINFKKISKSGSIGIPVSLRREYGINQGDSFEISVNDKGNIILNRHVTRCMFCDSTENVTIFKSKPVCNKCREELRG